MSFGLKNKASKKELALQEIEFVKIRFNNFKILCSKIKNLILSLKKKKFKKTKKQFSKSFFFKKIDFKIKICNPKFNLNFKKICF